MLSLSEILNWTGSNVTQKIFVDAERILEAGHLIKCGKNIDKTNNDIISFSAFCVQTSRIKERPHEINGIISKEGKIVSVQCSCKAGMGEKCKHVGASLLYYYR